MSNLNLAKEYAENLRNGISLTRQEMRLTISALYDELCKLEEKQQTETFKTLKEK